MKPILHVKSVPYQLLNVTLRLSPYKLVIGEKTIKQMKLFIVANPLKTVNQKILYQRLFSISNIFVLSFINFKLLKLIYDFFIFLTISLIIYQIFKNNKLNIFRMDAKKDILVLFVSSAMQWGRYGHLGILIKYLSHIIVQNALLI